jgi:hypothetical protein
MGNPSRLSESTAERIRAPAVADPPLMTTPLACAAVLTVLFLRPGGIGIFTNSRRLVCRAILVYNVSTVVSENPGFTV